jgi:hypothetical protein
MNSEEIIFGRKIQNNSKSQKGKVLNRILLNVIVTLHNQDYIVTGTLMTANLDINLINRTTKMYLNLKQLNLNLLCNYIIAFTNDY